MRNERVFITGCGGMLGNAVYPYFMSRYSHVLATDKDVTEKWLLPLDVRDDARLERAFEEFRPNLVLHLAAETDLEYCEMNSKIAEDTNSRATGTVADLCRRYDATLVYISTAGVFDGTKDGLYTEEDKPNPIMVYGRTKYDGEIKARRWEKFFVVRAGWMMGGGREKEKKFIYKILEQVAEGKKEIFAVDDLWGTPTYTHDFAMNLFALIDSGCYGTYHMGCEGFGTRFDVARQILSICGRDDIELTPVDSTFFSERYFVTRPRSAMITNVGLRRIGCHYMRNWKVALREYLQKYFADFVKTSETKTVYLPERPKPVQVQKRRRPRAESSLPVSYFFHDSAAHPRHQARTVDVSDEGLGILTESLLETGSVITLRQGSDSWRTAVVRWVVQDGEAFRVGLWLLDATLGASQWEQAHDAVGIS